MDDIYEVERNEYAGMIGQMKTECFDMEREHTDECTIIKLISKKTNKLITKRIIHENGEEQYFIYEMPDNDERTAPKRIRQITLETREEVEHFFKALSELQRKSK